MLLRSLFGKPTLMGMYAAMGSPTGDLLHSHLTIGQVEGCPACTQLVCDFYWIGFSKPMVAQPSRRNPALTEA